MPTLKELLDDAQFADGLTFELNGVKGTLGDLRAARGSALEETRAAQAKRQQAEQLANEAATLLSQLQEAARNPAATAKPQEPGTIDWRKDPLFAPLLTDLDSAIATAKEAKRIAEDQANSLKQTSAIYAYERMKTQFERAGKSVEGKKFEDLAQRAIAEKHFDRFGLPTLEPIIERETEPLRIKTASDEAVAAARKQWEAEQAASAAKPGAAGGRFNVRKPADKPIARIEDLTSDVVANDPDIQAAMRGETVH